MKKLICLTLMLFSLIFVLVGCGDSDDNKYSSQVKIGEEITVTEDMAACKTKDDVSDFVNYVQQNNKDAENQMFENGKARIIAKGNKITIDDKGVAVFEIKDEDGNDWYAVREEIDAQDPDKTNTDDKNTDTNDNNYNTDTNDTTK